MAIESGRSARALPSSMARKAGNRGHMRWREARFAVIEVTEASATLERVPEVPAKHEERVARVSLGARAQRVEQWPMLMGYFGKVVVVMSYPGKIKESQCKRHPRN